MPRLKTGKVIKCKECGKEVYKYNCHLKMHKHYFCSRKCANLYQGRNKIKFICKVCGEEFRWSKSRINKKYKNNPTYCSIKCRNQDNDWVVRACIKGNLVQQRKKGLNKLELMGRKILKKIGIKFKEQILMFNKFLVDILISNKKIIIQWDGCYWHNKPKRIKLDKSQDAYFKKCGYKVIRITDKQFKNERKVYDYLKRTIR